MAPPSIRAQIADLLGEDAGAPEPGTRPKPERLTMAEALRSHERGSLIATRDDDGEALVLAVLEDGSRVLMPDSCPHDGGLLSSGFVEGNVVVCARHGWEFDGLSGVCTLRPSVRIHCTALPRADAPPDASDEPRK